MSILKLKVYMLCFQKPLLFLLELALVSALCITQVVCFAHVAYRGRILASSMSLFHVSVLYEVLGSLKIAAFRGISDMEAQEYIQGYIEHLYMPLHRVLSWDLLLCPFDLRLS